jgi:hypothetical protein
MSTYLDALLSAQSRALSLATNQDDVDVDVASSPPPSEGQTLVATGPGAATWQTPASGVTLGVTAPTQVAVTTAVPGAGTTAARSDHVHSVATAAPVALAIGGASFPGTSTSLARADHAHGLPAFGTGAGAIVEGNDPRLSDDRVASGVRTLTTVVATAGATAPSTGQVLTATGPTAATWQTGIALTVAPASQVSVTAAVSGGAATAARADHVHSVATDVPVALSVGGTSVPGSSTSLARADHAHGLPAFGSTSGTIAQGNDARLSDDRTASGVRTATTVVATAAASAPSSGQVLTATGASAATWQTPASGVSLATSQVPSQVSVTTAVPGTGVTAARDDHVHSVATASPVDLVVGGTNAPGGSTSLARADHVHALPAFGTAAGTFAQGNDGRLSDDRIASGLRTASTVVATAAATAPSVGQVLTATSPGAATWQTPLALTSSIPSTVSDTTASFGAATDAARRDHIHAVSIGAPAALTVGGAANIGDSTSLARANHVHAMPGIATSGVDGFISAANQGKLDGISPLADVTLTKLAAASAPVSFNTQRLTNVLDPTAAQDAATKAYVDAIAQGLDTKASCRLVATTNVASLSGSQTIDGIATVTGDRVLLTAQTTASANGIYVTAAGAWARAADADTSADVTSGMYTFIVAGTANADSGWALITPDPIVLGTPALTFTQVTGAGQLTAGAGLTKTGNTIDVVAHADGSIVVAADSVQVGILATDAQHGTRGGGTTHAAVIAGGASGFITGADKTRLDGMATGAAAVASTTPVAADVTAAAPGVATTAARSDHRHQVTAGSPVALTLAGATADGTSTALARADHVHALPASGTPVALTLAGTNAAGSAATLALSDHVHALPATATPVALTVAGANAPGSAVTLARSDHVHALSDAASTAYVDALPIKQACRVVSTTPITLSGLQTIDGILVSANNRVLVAGQASWQTDGIYLASTGAWTRALDADTSAELPPGMLVPIGPEGTTYPNTVWQMKATPPVVLGTSAMPFALVSSTLATTAPANVGAAAAIGNAVTTAHADHVHAHGAQTDGTMHAVATTSTAGFLSSTDKTRLDALGALRTRSYFDVRLATATTLPAYTATTISTNRPRLTATANGALSVDGVAVVAGDLVLVLFEAVANCGVYEVINAGAVGAPYQLDLAYSGAYTALVSGSQMVVRTGTAGYAYCNREFRPGSTSSGLFVEVPGELQVWPRDTTPPTTIYPGWLYELDLLGTGTVNLTLVSPAGSEQVLRGVRFGFNHSANITALTITPSSPSRIDSPYGSSGPTGGVPSTSATYAAVGGSAATWVCGRGYTSYNPDSPYWKVDTAYGLAAESVVVVGGRVDMTGSAPAAGSALIATGATTMAFTAPGLPAALTVGGAQAPGTANSHARSDHAHAMPAVATPSVSGFLSSADKTALDLLVAAQNAPWVVETNPGSLLYADEFSPGSNPDLATLGYTCRNAATGATMTRAGNVNFATVPALTATQYNSTIIGSWLYLQTGAVMTVTKTMAAPFGCIAVRGLPSNAVSNTQQRCGVFVADGTTYSTSKKVMAGFVDGVSSALILGGSSQTGTGTISATGSAPVAANDDSDIFVLSKGTSAADWGMSIRKADVPAVAQEFWYLTPALADTATTFGIVVHSGNTGAGQRHVAIDYIRRYPANTFFGY